MKDTMTTDEIGEEILKMEKSTEQEKSIEKDEYEWSEPIPLDDESELPKFPTQVLPRKGREMVEAVAETNQVSRAMAGTAYIAVLATVLQKKAYVDLETHTEPLSIYAVTAAEPGKRKSQTLRDITFPIYEYQKEQEEKMRDEIARAGNTYKIKTERLAHLQKQAARAEKEGDRNIMMQQAEVLASDIEQNPVPHSPEYVLDDVTPEKLIDVMASNNECGSIHSAEGGIFGLMDGRYTGKKGGPNIDIYLKAHAGDPASTHRIGRQGVTLANPALSMNLMVQPEILYQIGDNRGFRNRGLLARFLYSYDTSKIGTRFRQKTIIPDGVRNEYNQHIKELMDITYDDRKLIFSPEAEQTWKEFYNDVERSMQAGGDLDCLSDWGSKLSGAVARIAGLFHIAQHGIETNIISAGIVAASCSIGGFFKDHALYSFGIMKQNAGIESARRILEYIDTHEPEGEGKPDTFKARDVLAVKRAFNMIDEILPGLEVLIDRGYIREIEPEYQGRGRPSATEYEINSLCRKRQQKQQNS
jgi:hypothetical protein